VRVHSWAENGNLRAALGESGASFRYAGFSSRRVQFGLPDHIGLVRTGQRAVGLASPCYHYFVSFRIACNELKDQPNWKVERACANVEKNGLI
jgi:hypothetical protein